MSTKHVPDFGKMPNVKRLRQVARNIPAVLSLLLGATLLIFWIRSYARIDRFDYVRAPACYTVNTACGHFDIELDNNAGYAIPDQGFSWMPWSGPQGARDESMVITTIGTRFPMRTQFLGFTWGPPRGSQYVITGSFLSPFLAACIIPVCRLANHGRRVIRRRRRRSKGSCLKCGYDLRATPDRCPECGATIAAK